jgi:hypothetical protein
MKDQTRARETWSGNNSDSFGSKTFVSRPTPFSLAEFIASFENLQFKIIQKFTQKQKPKSWIHKSTRTEMYRIKVENLLGTSKLIESEYSVLKAFYDVIAKIYSN